MHWFGKMIAPVFKAEILGLHYANNLVMFFAFLPLLGSETSGRKPGPVLEAWKKRLEIRETDFAKMQMGQMRQLNKLGVLDSKFIDKRTEDYVHSLRGPNESIIKEIDAVIKMNESGALSDQQTAIFLEKAGNSSELSFGYNTVIGEFFSLHEQTESQAAVREAAFDKLTDWGMTKADKLLTIKGKAQQDFASALASVFQRIPFSTHESENMALSVCLEDENYLNQTRLCIIFKKAVDGTGQPLVASAGHADFLPDMITWLEQTPQSREEGRTGAKEREVFAKFLRDYTSKI